jgi:hypothetical protein
MYPWQHLYLVQSPCTNQRTDGHGHWSYETKRVCQQEGVTDQPQRSLLKRARKTCATTQSLNEVNEGCAHSGAALSSQAHGRPVGFCVCHGDWLQEGRCRQRTLQNPIS